MAHTEIYRYFWIKATDAAARTAASKASLDLQQNLIERSNAIPPDSPEASDLRVQQDMSRWYLAGETAKGTKIVVISPAEPSLSLEVLPTSGQVAALRGVEIELAAMPAGYTEQLSNEWIHTPVGQVWSAGALACRLSHAVTTPTGKPRRSRVRTR